MCIMERRNLMTTFLRVSLIISIIGFVLRLFKDLKEYFTASKQLKKDDVIFELASRLNKQDEKLYSNDNLKELVYSCVRFHSLWISDGWIRNKFVNRNLKRCFEKYGVKIKSQGKAQQ